jgi:hypothetical protein
MMFSSAIHLLENKISFFEESLNYLNSLFVLEGVPRNNNNKTIQKTQQTRQVPVAHACNPS